MTTDGPNAERENTPEVPPHTQPHTEPIEYEGPPLLSRRGFIKSMMGLALGGVLLGGGAATLLPALAPSALGGGGRQPVILRDEATNAKIPVTLDMLRGDPPVVVTAEWNFLPAVVYKVHRSILEASSRKRGYNTAQFAFQHPSEPDHAVLVYEGKCKHLGCTVDWNGQLGGSSDIPDYNEDGQPDGRILCPCHQGQYDIYDLALNVPGTPPPEPLNVVLAAIGSHTDEATGESFSNVLLGFDKIVQTSARAADRDGAGAPFALGSQKPEES